MQLDDFSWGNLSKKLSATAVKEHPEKTLPESRDAKNSVAEKKPLLPSPAKGENDRTPKTQEKTDTVHQDVVLSCGAQERDQILGRMEIIMKNPFKGPRGNGKKGEKSLNKEEKEEALNHGLKCRRHQVCQKRGGGGKPIQPERSPP